MRLRYLHGWTGWTVFCLLACLAGSASAQLFRLPTSNRALFEKGGEARFFAPTVGRPWTSGMFGCVRTDGMQMHEGLDILSVQRDRRGEPTDPVAATADGVVAYVNAKSGLSNYGRYLILRHVIEGLEVYSLYAHLAQIRSCTMLPIAAGFGISNTAQARAAARHADAIVVGSALVEAAREGRLKPFVRNLARALR